MKTLIARHKAGEHIGICSVCSAHPLVIEAALAFDRNSTRKVLIEATSNQVNQFGGYTGMTPADFREFVFAIADKVGCAEQTEHMPICSPALCRAINVFMFFPC